LAGNPTAMTNCKNCDTPLQGQYCYECGQRVITQRLSMRIIFRNLVEIFTNVDRGFFYTIKELLRHPERVITDFVNGATVSYINPFRFLLLTVGLSTLINISLGLYDLQAADINENINTTMGLEHDSEMLERQQRLQTEMKKYVNLIPLLVVPFISLTSFLFFKRLKYNYAEHLVMNSFFFGTLSFIGIPLLLLFAFFPQLIAYAMPVGLIVGIIYYTYATRRLFQFSVVSTFFRSIGVYVGGFLTAMLTFAILGFFVGLAVAIFF